MKRLVAGCLALALAACSSSGDKPEPAELVSFKEEVELDKVWSRDIGSVSDARWHTLVPALAGERIYAADLDGDITALNRQTGKKIWAVDVDEAIASAVGANDKLLAVGTFKGEVLALSADDGSELWRTQLSSETMAAPQISGETVVVQTIDGKLYGLDVDGGAQRWVYEVDLPVLTLRGVGQPVLYGDTVYAGFANGRLAALDINTGIPRWEQRVAIPKGRTELERMIDIDGGPLVTMDIVYAASYQGNIVAFTRASGRPEWNREMSTYRQLVRSQGMLFAVTESDVVQAFDAYTGVLKWENRDLSLRGLTGPQMLSGHVAVADRKGYLHLLSPEDGRFLSRRRIDSSGVRIEMVSDGETLYALAESGDLVALRVEQD